MSQTRWFAGFVFPVVISGMRPEIKLFDYGRRPRNADNVVGRTTEGGALAAEPLPQHRSC